MNWLTIIAALGVVFESAVSSNSLHLSRVKRLIGGVNASIEKFPYAVALENDEEGQFCVGAILSSRHIITLSSCLSRHTHANETRVRAGSSLREVGGTIHHARAQKMFSYINLSIGIVQLAEPIEFDNATKGPISMFEAGERVENGTDATVLGWGISNYQSDQPDQLKSIEINVVNDKKCDELEKKTLYLKREYYICAGGKNQSICVGDSGGPMVINGKLAGIAAAAAGCVEPNAFIEVAHFRKWIDETVLGFSD